MNIDDFRYKIVRAIREMFSKKDTFIKRTNNINVNIESAKMLLQEDNEIILLDVRTIDEYNEGHIPGAICITDYELEKNIFRVVPNKFQKILVYCTSGNRSEAAVGLLRNLGYINSYNIDGGLNNWY